MPRPLRITSAGLRHVTCRGNRRQAIFRDEVDRESFLRSLGEACRTLAWRVRVWCLLTNHLHLVVHVPADTVSRGMQWLTGRYAQDFNWRHGCGGHLFQGRFRMEAVEDEGYEFELYRYVDLNPERAGVVRDSRHWRWCGYRAELGFEPPRPFHDLGWVSRFGSDLADARAGYAAYVAAGRNRPRPAQPPTPRRPTIVSFGPVWGLTPDRATSDVSWPPRRPGPE